MTSIFPRYIIVVVTLLAATSVVAGHPARDVTDKMEAGIISSMKMHGAVSDKALYSHVEELLVSTHDLPFILGLTMGRNWRKLDETQQTELLGVFIELSVTTYLSRFRVFSGERFKFSSEELIGDDQYFIHSILVTSKGVEITFDYHCRSVNDEWRIVNIIANNVSDLALKRAEYSKLMRDEGYPGLISEIRRQIDVNKKNATKNKKLKPPK